MSAPPSAGPPTGPLTEAALAAQETALVLPRFTHDDAWRLGSLLVDLARERGAAVIVHIRAAVTVHIRAAASGSSTTRWTAPLRTMTPGWSARSARYGASSMLVGERFRAKRTTFEAASRLDQDRYAAHGGAFPLRVTGVGVIGAVGVSGLPQAADHALVTEGLTRFLAEVSREAGREE